MASMHAERLAPATVGRYWAAVRIMLKDAHRSGLIPVDPTDGVYPNRKAPRRREDTRDKILTAAQLYAVLDTAEEGTRDRLLLEVLAWTGAADRGGARAARRGCDVRRAADAADLAPVDLARRVAVVHEDREQPAHDRDRPGAGAAAVAGAGRPARHRGDLRHPHRQPVERLRGAAGGREGGTAGGVRISPHCLRHTRITHMLQAGNRSRDVADYAGDREETIIKHYSHAILDTRLTLPRRVELAPVLPPVEAPTDGVGRARGMPNPPYLQATAHTGTR